jgi:hypothetical protein
MPNPFDPLQLTPRDLFRAAPVLKEQAGLDDVDPYDLLDVEGDRYLRRVLVIWCLKSREDPEVTWEQAWDTPLGDLFDEGDEAAVEAPLTQGPATPGTGPETEPKTNGNAGKRRKRPAAEPALNSSATTP